MNYRQLFNISIQHSFNTDGNSKAFSIVPTDACIRKMKGLGLIHKVSLNGLNVLIGLQTEDNPDTPGNDIDQPLVPIANGTTLDFSMVIRDPNFLSYTDFSAIDALADPEDPPKGSKIIPLYANNGSASSGSLTLSKTHISAWARDVWAQISIDYQDFLGQATPPVFDISFSGESVVWRYYLIANADEVAGDYSIIDGATSPSLSFQAAQDLASSPDSTDTVAALLARNFADKSRFRIESTAAIPYQEAARRNIRLQRSGSVMIAHLPNPSFLDLGASIVNLTN